MKFLKGSIMIILLLLGALAYAELKSKDLLVSDAKARAVHITVDALKQKIVAGEKFFLIDVRTEKEYMSGHIKGAVWISRGTLEFDIQDVTADPKADIVVYCRSGARGSLSMLALKDLGYVNVKDLDGGFKNWVTLGNNVYNMHGEIKVVNYGKKEND
jgi:rhodanese-related sulfurtransferase